MDKISRQQKNKHFISNYISELIASYYVFKNHIITSFKDELKTADHVHMYSLMFILLLGAAIRIYLSSYKHVLIDEGIAVHAFSMQPLSHSLKLYWITGNHLFYTFLSHITYRLFGMDPWALRLPATVAGILIIPATYLFVRFFYNKHAALLASAFVASSISLIRFSVEARGYTVIILFFLLILVIATYLKQDRNLFLWLLFSVLSALGAWTVTIMLYPFGIVFIFLFLSSIFNDTGPDRNRFLKDLFVHSIIVLLITLFLYSPVIINGYGKTIYAAYNLVPQEWAFFMRNVTGTISATWGSWNNAIPDFISYILVTGFFISIFFHRKLSRHRISLLLSALVWLIPLILIQRVFGGVRIWLFLLPVYFCLASSGIYYLLSGFIKPRHKSYRSLIFSVLSIVIIITLGAGSIQAHKKEYYKIKDTLIDPDYVSVLLRDNYVPGDVFTYIQVYNQFNFAYHFQLNNVPSDRAIDRAKAIRKVKPKRLLVYVNYFTAPNMTIDMVLNNVDLSIKDFSSPTVFRRDKYGAIYILTPLIPYNEMKSSRTAKEAGDR